MTTRIPSIFELQLPKNCALQFETKDIITEELKEESGEHQKGIWASSEDEALKSAIARCGEPISWEEVAKSVIGRTPKQCRERWLFRLCPSVNKSPFQKWEDELIVYERQQIGNRWTAIAAKLPGRTSCAVKNRWYTVLRNRVVNRPMNPMQLMPISFAPYGTLPLLPTM